MQFLLDTHTFIWFINGDSSLSNKVLNEIKNLNNQCFISIASIWEIAIKSKLNKLSLSADFDKILDFLNHNQIELLPISFIHIIKLNELDFHHRDPFDRILIAQGITEDLTILTRDQSFGFYEVKVLW